MSENDNSANSNNSISRICSGTEIIGNIINTNDIRVDGVIRGNITAKGKIVIGETGSIQGEVTCSNVDIMGKFEGKICVKELLSLKSTADVQGEICTDKFMIEAGASFIGTSTKYKDPAHTPSMIKSTATHSGKEEIKNRT